MSPLSFPEKLKILWEVTTGSYWMIFVALLLGILGIVFLTTNHKTLERNRMIYILLALGVLTFVILMYHDSLFQMGNYMMDHFFIALYFPNLAIYFVAIIITNVIFWMSVFQKKITKPIQIVNVLVYIIIHYLLTLIISVVNTEQLNVFQDSSLYQNEKVTALVELSSMIFILWILFLASYKIILWYLSKGKKEENKVVMVKKEIKKLPSHYEPTSLPKMVKGTKKERIKIVEPSKEMSAMEEMLTVEDYKLLLKMLQEKKKKDSERKREQDKITELERLYKSIS